MAKPSRGLQQAELAEELWLSPAFMAGFLLVFYPEDGGKILFRNVG
jgi:hypothetical protein